MKNNVLKLIKYLYYFSLIALIVLYLFPGSIIGYILYGDLGRQPIIVDNPIGNSINHLIYFVYLTTLLAIYNIKQHKFFANFNFIFFLSIILEILHFIIPNRAFELYDLCANMAGVLIVILFKKIIKWSGI